MNISERELRRRLKVAKQFPSLAHLPSFGLVVGAGQGPTCTICGGVNAPIVGGKHLKGWCEKNRTI